MANQDQGGGQPPRIHRGNKSQVKRKARRLVREAGLPPDLAFQVASGGLALNAVLEKMARKDQVEGLMRRFNLSKSTAMQVALGQIELDEVLRRERMNAERQRSRERSFLTEAEAAGSDVLLALHGRQVEVGRVASVGQYDFALQTLGSGTDTTIHKLQVKWACLATERAAVVEARQTDAALDRDMEPIAKPQDRKGISDKRLFGYLDELKEVAVTSLEGDRFVGNVGWIGRWEFGMVLAGDVKLTVFRHAVSDIRET